MKYEVVIWWSDEDSAFLAEMPELPGCMADGQTKEEVIRNIEEAAKLWVEAAQLHGHPVPEPKGRLRYA